MAEKSIIKPVTLRDNYMTHNLGGRPKIELTQKEIEEVEGLSAHFTLEQMADYFGIAKNTFLAIRDRQPEVFELYKKGRAKKHLKYSKHLEAKAMGESIEGDSACLMFYLKTQAGWRETQSIETKDTTPSKQLPQINIHVNDKPEHRLKD